MKQEYSIGHFFSLAFDLIPSSCTPLCLNTSDGQLKVQTKLRRKFSCQDICE